jgi:hypothetical protein
MSEVMGVRLLDREKEMIEQAAELEAEPGDRGGASSWLRRVGLREARRVLARHGHIFDADGFPEEST